MSNIDPLEIQMFLRTVLRIRRKYKYCRLDTVRYSMSFVLMTIITCILSSKN